MDRMTRESCLGLRLVNVLEGNHRKMTSYNAYRFAAMVLCLCLLTSCSGKETDWPTIDQSDRLTLYEGLPHPIEDATSFNSEKKTRPTLEVQNYLFYREPLELNEPDSQSLKALLKAPSTFSEFLSEKKCGGFHPDYALKWEAGAKSYHALICFGCFEAMLVGPKGAVRYDIQLEAARGLSGILGKYHRDRPTSTRRPLS